MIYVLNYGAGNILSITSAIKEINRDFELIDSPVSYESKDILLIPGVGNFKSASSNLIRQGFGHLNLPNNHPLFWVYASVCKFYLIIVLRWVN